VHLIKKPLRKLLSKGLNKLLITNKVDSNFEYKNLIVEEY